MNTDSSGFPAGTRITTNKGMVPIEQIKVGDSVQLRIVQPRRPCYKINDQIGQLTKVPNIAAWVSKQGISGWYFQVVRDGMINADLPVYLIERPYPFATLEKLWQLSNLKEKFDAEVIEPWLAIECLEASWKKVLAKKIKRT